MITVFRLLTAYFGLIIFVGCFDANEKAPLLLKTEPAEGAEIGYDDVILFVFDKPVQLVKVNGIDALPRLGAPSNRWSVPAKQLDLKFPKYVSDPAKKVTLNVTYQDNEDFHQTTVTFFAAGLITYHITPLLIAKINVRGIDDLSSEFLNENGITIGFNKPVIVEKASIEIKPVGGDPLVWVAEWDDNSSVTIAPLKGQGLVNGTEYVLEIKNVEDAAGQVLNTQIMFTTTD